MENKPGRRERYHGMVTRKRDGDGKTQHDSQDRSRRAEASRYSVRGCFGSWPSSSTGLLNVVSRGQAWERQGCCAAYEKEGKSATVDIIAVAPQQLLLHDPLRRLRRGGG